MRRRWLPDNVTPFKDKCGRTRYRFRKKGLPQYLFRAEPGSPEFMEEYDRAKNAVAVKKEKHAAGTFNAVIESYYRSKRWARMQESTRAMRRNILERFRAKQGHKPVNRLEARHVDKWMSEMADTPHAANNLRKILAQIMKHAIMLGLRRDNPVDVIDAIQTDGDGFHCWSEEEIAQYDAKWALGTRERLAKELLLYTSLRRGDMVKIGRQHRKGDKLILRHAKNKSDTVIRILDPLAKALDAIEAQHLTYLVTQTGKPFTPAGFGNWFRERCDQAGLNHCTAHGLRKAMARRLAESGATTMQGRAVTGHRSDAMFIHYAAKANREAMADEALERMAENIGIGGKPVDKFANSGQDNG
ncbi:tyrosine-type recombinase/integrase [Sphingobium sp. DC-2]|uniref:tyrosine-type recombinase/integrase n=1 Tax=Sphingobium sp. DC-2 TaxID=1303256 RepID=UPI0004C46005|nr:tyrosine-type recombinase/integrase [Sphingobium sp. DC-2]